MGEILGRDGEAGVVHRQLDAAHALAQRYVHAAAVVGVLACVVQQRAHQLAQPHRIAAHHDALVQLRLQIDGALERHGLELQQLAFHQVGEVEPLHGRRRGALVDLREQQQVAYQALHLLRFVLSALDPLALAGDAALGMLQQDGRVREDHGEGRLQIVRSVGYEPALLAPCAIHWRQRPPREEHADHEERSQRRRAHARQCDGQGLPAACGAHVREREVRGASHGALLVEQP